MNRNISDIRKIKGMACPCKRETMGTELLRRNVILQLEESTYRRERKLRYNPEDPKEEGAREKQLLF